MTENLLLIIITCEAHKANGTRCQRQAQLGSKKCWQHGSRQRGGYTIPAGSGITIYKATVNQIPLMSKKTVYRTDRETDEVTQETEYAPRSVSGSPEVAASKALMLYVMEYGHREAYVGRDRAIPVILKEVTKGGTQSIYRLLAWFEPGAKYQAVAIPVPLQIAGDI